MPFEITEEQRDIYKAAMEWAQGKYEKEGWDADRIREQEKKHEFPKDLFKEACELGFFGAWIPEKYGGQWLGVLDRCLIAEALCTVDPIFGFLDAGLFGSEAIYLHGTEEQKEKYLSRVPKGDIIFACGFTEPSGGTDVASARTTAVK